MFARLGIMKFGDEHVYVVALLQKVSILLLDFS